MNFFYLNNLVKMENFPKFIDYFLLFRCIYVDKIGKKWYNVIMMVFERDFLKIFLIKIL